MTFESYPLPKLANCKTKPPKGNPLTKFKIQCDYDKNSTKNFEIEVKTKDTIVFSSSSPSIEDIEFLVSSKADVVVKIIDFNDVWTEKTIEVEVQSLVKGVSNFSLATDKLLDIYEGRSENTTSVEKLMDEGNYESAVQIIDVLTREIAEIKTTNEDEKKILQNAKKKLLKDLSKIPIDEISMSKSVSGVISLLANEHKDNESNADMASNLAATCSNIAKKQLYLMENDFDEKVREEDVINVADNLLNCGESELAPNYEMFSEDAIEIEVSTRFPIIENLSEKTFEDYPQYVADDLIEEKAFHFLDAANNLIQICRDMGDSLIHSISAYKKAPTYITRSNTTIGVFKSSGERMVKTKFKQHEVEVIPTSYLQELESTFAIRLCTFKDDPMWAASEYFKIPTNILDISIRDLADNSEIKKFGDYPMNVSFVVLKERINEKHTIANVSKLTKNSKFIEDEFVIFKIKAKAEESFFIDFYGLNESDNLAITVNEMERPKLKFFTKSMYINKGHNKVFIDNIYKEDTWFFLSILQAENTNFRNFIPVNFSVFTPRCIKWNQETKTWNLACSIYMSTTPSIIHCRCLHISTLAGAFYYNDIGEHPKFIGIDFKLKFQRSFYVLIIVTILVAIYFFLLIYSIQKNQTIEDNVYFLSDVRSENRYSYLLWVRTGARIDAGTTSDIVIKLFGTEGTSEEHVLNFPDPFLEFLQRNQDDIFVLATSKHLGKLVKIQIWFDSTGISPAWYCNSIKICDMQTGRWYMFKVKHWLRVQGKPTLILNVDSSRDHQKNDQKRTMFTVRVVFNFGHFKNTIWDLSTSTKEANLEYTKRLTTILSIFLTIFMVCLEIYGRPVFLPQDAITADCYYRLDWYYLYVGLGSALITFIPHLLLIECFRKSDRYQLKPSSEGKICPLVLSSSLWWGFCPYRSSLILIFKFHRALLILNILFNIHILLIHGSRIIPPTVWQWMTSILIAVPLYIFVIDYVFNVVRTFLGKIRSTVIFNMDKVLENIEIQRKFLYTTIGHFVYRPILSSVYKLMSRANYMRKKIEFRQKREVIWQIQDLFMIIAFMTFLYLIVLAERDSTYDHLGHEQVEMLLNGFPSTGSKLEDIKEIDELEDFLEFTFLPSIQSYEWYGRYVSDSPGMTRDQCNRYLGVIRLRQHRVEDQSCPEQDLMKFVNRTCRSSSYFFHYDYLNYTPGWKDTIPRYHPTKLGSIWGYHEGTGDHHFGVVGFYSSGGYIALLGRTLHNSLVNFNYMKRYSWFDPFTRAVIIEFLLYNVNKNIFHFVKIIVEKTSTGLIYKEIDVHTEKILAHSTTATTFTLICGILFMVVVLVFCIRTTIRIIKTKTWYKRDLWHLVDVGIICLSIVWITMYFKRLELLFAFVQQLEEKRSNVFIDYFSIASAENLLTALTSILICVTTIRIWKLLRFAVVFRTVERTLIYSTASLLLLFLYYILCCIGFGIMAFILLGSKSEHFQNFHSTMETLILLTIGMKSPKELSIEENESGAGYFFVLLFHLFSFFIATIFVAVIMVNYVKAQQFAFNEILDYNMKDYTKDKINILKRLTRIWIRKFRLRAGSSDVSENMLTPKSDEIRFMNSLQADCNRIEAMANITKCILSKEFTEARIDETDHMLMMRIVKSMLDTEQGESEFWFIEGTRETGYTFVNNKRITDMEQVVRAMIEGPTFEKLKIEDVIFAENMARITKLKNRLKIISQALHTIKIKE